MKLDLKELVNAQVIDQATADKIAAFQKAKVDNSPSRLLIAFGVLGAILVGLGIMLIVAHNWDQFPRSLKLFLACLPMLLGQLVCGYTLLKKPESAVWRESSSVFLVFAVGACIATISQIYNIQGDLSSFLLTWLLLGMPLIYVMKSSAVSLLYIGGVIWFAMLGGLGENSSPWIAWGLFALSLPHYYYLWKNRPTSNFFYLHSWLIAFAGLVLLGTAAQSGDNWLWVAYMSLLGIYYFIGTSTFQHYQLRHNPFLVISVLGTIGIFLFFSFDDNWHSFYRENDLLNTAFEHRPFWVAMMVTLIAIVLLVRHLRTKENSLHPIPFGFLLFLFLFVVAAYNSLSAVIISNLFVLGVGIFYIYQGGKRNQLSILNLGLVTTAILIIARFLDIDMSFIARGILFIIMGVGFFMANYRLIKSAKK